jgi:hypothetical protein
VDLKNPILRFEKPLGLGACGPSPNFLPPYVLHERKGANEKHHQINSYGAGRSIMSIPDQEVINLVQIPDRIFL